MDQQHVIVQSQSFDLLFSLDMLQPQMGEQPVSSEHVKYCLNARRKKICHLVGGLAGLSDP